MPHDPDSWNDLRGAEIYGELVREGTIYRVLAAGLAEALQPRPSERFLDLATGTGVCAGALLARAGMDIRVLGLDASRAMLEVAREELPLPEIGLAAADPSDLPFRDAVFDGALCSAAFWHFPALPRVFSELFRVLRPGGRFAFNIPAHQLEDVEDLPPAAFQLALVRVGVRLFGIPPAPAGPVLRRAFLVSAAAENGFSLAAGRVFEVVLPQQELIDLLSVPAIGSRLYPQATPAQRRGLIAAAAARVSGTEPVRSRWWEALLTRN